MATYAYVREQVVQGVIRAAAASPRTPLVPPSLDRIRAQFDAGIFSINSQTAQAYAAQESRRELLRASNDITITSGSGTLPTSTLKAFIEDSTFVVAATPTKKYSFRRYPQWLRTGDTRLGYWTNIGETIKVKTPQPVSVTPTLTATFTSICSPDIPATENATFVAPDDYLPDLIAAMIQYILGQTMEMAAQTA